MRFINRFTKCIIVHWQVFRCMSFVPVQGTGILSDVKLTWSRYQQTITKFYRPSPTKLKKNEILEHLLPHRKQFLFHTVKNMACTRVVSCAIHQNFCLNYLCQFASQIDLWLEGAVLLVSFCYGTVPVTKQIIKAQSLYPNVENK